MTVAELIEKLKEMDQEAVVIVHDSERGMREVSFVGGGKAADFDRDMYGGDMHEDDTRAFVLIHAHAL